LASEPHEAKVAFETGPQHYFSYSVFLFIPEILILKSLQFPVLYIHCVVADLEVGGIYEGY
jgi:hypothetical protein